MTPPHDETKMSNRERAKELDNQIMLNGRLRQGDQSVDLIEHALDEAEKRGAESSCDLGFNDGYISGQKEMRERAAKEMDEKVRHDHTSGECPYCEMPKVYAKDIRAIPIEGE